MAVAPISLTLGIGVAAASQLQMPYPMPITMNLAPDGRVLWFTLVLTARAGLAY